MSGACCPDGVAVAAAQGGAGQDQSAVAGVGESRADCGEPGPAVLVGEGVPAAILATFSTGWSESPSRNGTPSSRATRSPMVVLPQPETPMTMMRVD